MDSTQITAPETSRPEPQREPPFLTELARCWQAVPDKAVFLALAGLWVLFFHFLGNSTFGYIDTPSLFHWMSYSYRNSHDDELGFIIPWVVLGLFWWKRREFLALPRRPWWPAMILVLLALALHAMGYILQQTRISILAFFLGLYAFIGLVWGPRWLKASAFPFFLLVFCVPLNTLADVITFPLRLIVTRIAVAVSHFLGIHVLRNGTQIIDSAGTFHFEVAAACSGIRSLVTLFALTTIYGFLTFRAAWKRFLMMALALPLAITGNVLRVLAIIIAAEAFGQQAGVFMDRWFGFVTFAFALGCVLLIGRWLDRDEPAPGAGGEPSSPPEPTDGGGLAPWPKFAAVLLIVGASAWWLVQWKSYQRLGPPGVKLGPEKLYDTTGKEVANQTVALPDEVLNYQSEPQPITPLELGWLPKDTTFGRRIYRAPDGFWAMVSVVLMGTDRTSIHKPEFCLLGQGWALQGNEQITVPIQKPHPYELQVRKISAEQVITGPDGKKQALRGLYLYWFVAEDVLTADHKQRMWWMARHLVTARELQRWAYITYFAVCYPGQEAETLKRLERLMAASVPEFQLAVPGGPTNSGGPEGSPAVPGKRLAQAAD